MVLGDPLECGGVVSVERDLHYETAVTRCLDNLNVHRRASD